MADAETDASCSTATDRPDTSGKTPDRVVWLPLRPQVCPANWKPGSKSMVPDAEKSLEYFRSAGEVDSTMEDATKLTIINNKKEYDALLKSDKPVVIDFMASWCGKCSMIAPYIEELQVRCGNDAVSLCRTCAVHNLGVQGAAAFLAVPCMHSYSYALKCWFCGRSFSAGS